MINDPKSRPNDKKSLEEYILRDIYTSYKTVFSPKKIIFDKAPITPPIIPKTIAVCTLALGRKLLIAL